jgi:hypothetical protein
MMRSRKQQNSANGHCSLFSCIAERQGGQRAGSAGQKRVQQLECTHAATVGPYGDEFALVASCGSRVGRSRRHGLLADLLVHAKGALPDGGATADRFQPANWPMPYLLVLRDRDRQARLPERPAGDYELAVEVPANWRVAVALVELALAI